MVCTKPLFINNFYSKPDELRKWIAFNLTSLPRCIYLLMYHQPTDTIKNEFSEPTKLSGSNLQNIFHSIKEYVLLSNKTAEIIKKSLLKFRISWIAPPPLPIKIFGL